MRQVALSSRTNEQEVFTSEEFMVLSEKQYSLGSKGGINERVSFESALPVLLFTLKQYPKVHGAKFLLNAGDKGWKCMESFIAVRNRIVHSKSKSDREVTPSEWFDIEEGIQWFNSTVRMMFNECERADECFKKLDAQK